MMTDSKEADQQDAEMNSGLCMSAGIDTPTDADQSRFQRRHFQNRTTSNIFFCDYPAENNVSSSNDGDKEKSFPSAGAETRYDDQKQSERRHFSSPSEYYMQPENNADGNEEIDSSEADDIDHKQTDRRHFYEKTSSNIFFCGLPPEDITGSRTDPSDYRKRKG